MKKALSVVLTVLLGVSVTELASASSCDSLMCMAGKVQGQSGGGGCDQPIKDFFSIKRYHHGHLDLGPTSDARRQFLDQCPGSQQNASSIDGIISQFGTIE
ncbi:TrbM/KikA/MpfK family conjugal transfer protein [Caballeronia sp. LZ065]|uniref:TrbM/KikA/MpfK family conjugal transfer protein n=1 Tax=Caballeronia sp. LZ065 TaxID=3038571 RepID=UPI0028604B2B|nr:TrbM/KikA/MpfK family conjugal transfer protein [Caballeronia sp. LZ065]MDR5781243.1 TrbM/KikA/MpfK family conjugal transfer protein [Caballeronia sp. LZ065]